jgi:hypothetical protein
MDALKQRRAEHSNEEYLAERAIVARIQSDLAEFARGRGMPVIDLLDPFMDSEVRPYGEVDLSHPGVHGHQLTADVVFAALESNGLLR